MSPEEIIVERNEELRNKDAKIKELDTEVKRLNRALEDAGERAASLERVIRHLRDGDSVMDAGV